MQKSYIGRLQQWMHTGSACVSWKYYCETTKSMKICCHPVYYIVWSALCKQIYRTKISNVNELKRCINGEWTALRHAVIEHAVGKWRQCLRAWVCCVRAGGGDFEHTWCDVILRWCDVTRVTFSEKVTASRVCRCSVNHSNVNLIIALTAQSDTLHFPG